MTGFRILFVCVGNVCRSPLGERLLAALLPASDFEVSSAGVGALAGSPMDPEAAVHLEAYGASADGFVARHDPGHGRAERPRIDRHEGDPHTRPGGLAGGPAAYVHGAGAHRARRCRRDRRRPHCTRGTAADERSRAALDDYDIPDPYRRAVDAHAAAAEQMTTAVQRIAKALADERSRVRPLLRAVLVVVAVTVAGITVPSMADRTDPVARSTEAPAATPEPTPGPSSPARGQPDEATEKQAPPDQDPDAQADTRGTSPAAPVDHHRHRPRPPARQPPVPEREQRTGPGGRVPEAVQHDGHSDRQRRRRGHRQLPPRPRGRAASGGARRHGPDDARHQQRERVGSVRRQPRSVRWERGRAS